MFQVDELVTARAQHAKAFRERFPKQAAQLDAVLDAASRFSPMLLGEDPEAWSEDERQIAQILDDAVKDLSDAVEQLYFGRLKLAMVAIRCFLEQLFFSLYYREQGIDFALWRRSSEHFVMLHQLYSAQHPFRKFFQGIFEDRRDQEWKDQKKQGLFSKLIFRDLEQLYSVLSFPVHGRPLQRESIPGQPSIDEAERFCLRLTVAVSIAMEFFDIAGTGAEAPPQQFRYDSNTKVV